MEGVEEANASAGNQNAGAPEELMVRPFHGQELCQGDSSHNSICFPNVSKDRRDQLHK